MGSDIIIGWVAADQSATIIVSYYLQLTYYRSLNVILRIIIKHNATFLLNNSQDAHGNQFGQVIKDRSQDYQIILGYQYHKQTVLRFRRKLETCDGEDLSITVSINDTLFAATVLILYSFQMITTDMIRIYFTFRTILLKSSGHIVIPTLLVGMIVKLIPLPIYFPYFLWLIELALEVFTCTNRIIPPIIFISRTQVLNGQSNLIVFYFPPKKHFIGVRC